MPVSTDVFGHRGERDSGWRGFRRQAVQDPGNRAFILGDQPAFGSALLG